MKITKEIKLENPKRCDGCPMIADDGELSYCFLQYDFKIKGTTFEDAYIERPQGCIKENGE